MPALGRSRLRPGAGAVFLPTGGLAQPVWAASWGVTRGYSLGRCRARRPWASGVQGGRAPVFVQRAGRQRFLGAFRSMDQKNLVVAIAVSLAILLGFEYFISGPKREALVEQQAAQEIAQGAGQTAAPATSVPTPTIPGGATSLPGSVPGSLARDA